MLMRLVVIVMLLLLSLAGCVTEKPAPENKEWKVSPLFRSGTYTMIGQEGRLGFIYDDGEVDRFYPNKKQKYMWHFWGKPEELQGSLKVMGKSKETGEKIRLNDRWTQ
jgi:hypothetical protein